MQAGIIIIGSIESDKVTEVATVQCVHCSMHWPEPPNGWWTRGFCMRCNGPVCGPKCAKCVPVEAWLDNVEAGRPEDYRAATVAVPKLWLPG